MVRFVIILILAIGAFFLAQYGMAAILAPDPQVEADVAAKDARDKEIKDTSEGARRHAADDRLAVREDNREKVVGGKGALATGVGIAVAGLVFFGMTRLWRAS